MPSWPSLSALATRLVPTAPWKRRWSQLVDGARAGLQPGRVQNPQRVRNFTTSVHPAIRPSHCEIKNLYYNHTSEIKTLSRSRMVIAGNSG